MIRRLLHFMQEQLIASGDAPPSDYRHGFQTALKESIEYAEEIMWEEGVDDAEA